MMNEWQIVGTPTMDMTAGEACEQISVVERAGKSWEEVFKKVREQTQPKDKEERLEIWSVSKW